MSLKPVERVAASLGIAPGQLWVWHGFGYIIVMEVKPDSCVEYLSRAGKPVEAFQHAYGFTQTLWNWEFVGYTRDG